MSVRPVSNTFYCCQYLAGAIQPLTCLCALEIWALLCLLLPRSFLKNLLPLLAQGEGIWPLGDCIVCGGFSYRTHYVSCVTAIKKNTVICFQVILFTYFIIHQMKFGWLPRLGSLSFLFSWLFWDSHSGRRPNFPPDLTMLSVWLQVVIPGPKQRSKSRRTAGGRSWTRTGGGVGEMPDSNGDGDRSTKVGEGKQHGAAALCLQPALIHAVKEEGGSTRQRKRASNASYIPKWKINDHPTAWALCCTSQPRVVIGFNNLDCVFHTCWWLSLGAGFVKSGYLCEAGGTQANHCHFGKQGMWAQHRQ